MINDYRRYRDAHQVRKSCAGSFGRHIHDPNHFDDGRVALITAFSNEIGSLFNSTEQAEKIRASQEAALEKERQILREQNGLYQISRIFAGFGDFEGKETKRSTTSGPNALFFLEITVTNPSVRVLTLTGKNTRDCIPKSSRT